MATATTLAAPVVAAVFVAAVLHAGWNAIAHAVPDRLVGMTMIGTVSATGGAAMALVAPLPDRSAWPFIVASAVLHVVYSLLLIWSYRLGHFGQVYPLARGTSPWLVAIAAAVFAGESLPGPRLAGVLVVSAGLAVLVFSDGRLHRADLAPVTAALGTGVMIAAYTTVDGLGVRRAGTTAGYIAWLLILRGPALPLIAFATRGRSLLAQLRPHVLAGLVGGTSSLLAYGLVLWAQTRGPLAPIAALRETSVIIGAIIGTVLFHEPFGRQRILGTVVVVIGIVLINV